MTWWNNTQDFMEQYRLATWIGWLIMDRSATVTHDHLLQYMVNFNSMDSGYIVRWQSDIENTKERPLHKPSQDQRKSTALGGAWNFAERCIIICWVHMYLKHFLLTSRLPMSAQWRAGNKMAILYYTFIFVRHLILCISWVGQFTNLRSQQNTYAL